MVKLGCGAFMLFLGAILALWIVVNLFVARDRDFKLTLGGLAFTAGLFFVGTKWLSEGWPEVEQMFRPKKRKKKKKVRPKDEDED